MTAGIFAILLGLGGAYAVRQQLAAQPEPSAEQSPMVNLPLAAYDLPAGKRMAIKDILLISMTPEQAQKLGAGMAYLSDPSTIADRIVKNPIKAGQPFRSPDFFPEGMGPGIADLLEPGQVAVTVPVYGVGLVAGFVRAGAVVDVLFRSSGEYETTMRLLERAKVVAVGDSYLQNARVVNRDPAIMATLAVSPYQAQVLKAAENRGELTMTLHNPKNIAVSGFLGDSLSNAADFRVHLDALLGLPIGERKKAIEMYHGSRRSELVYERKPVFDTEGHIQTPVASTPPRGRAAQPRYSMYRLQSTSMMETTPPDPLENYTEPAGRETPAAERRANEAASFDPPRGQVGTPNNWAFAPRDRRRP